ncbi:hypothetical protein LEP1GSC202_1324 [Leptospira yanagawae serovar Saopaulo str. Sao Paulo = ATCC 700523]|uniref:DUF1877 family protein n=2 Tax=Leptospira TaxID=171 RepID=A0A4Z1A570_9LEPT|nr:MULTISPECIES: hypothetical protein [Leptospira]EOQ89860.1 hypothetical protein LEP1GSC202_1324 [Leptospira yanagawae serovar Saopaulo str. Sao Paulo = ATCC 700523]TGL65287.1 hypothetical protein EHQ62_11965 [Leptospira jelokensis]
MQTPFNIYFHPNELEGTAYIEFLPGNYLGKCWNENSIFLDENTFSIFEDVFEEIIESYDHYAFQELSESKFDVLLQSLGIRLEEIRNDSLFSKSGKTLSLPEKELIQKEIQSNKEGAIEVLERFTLWIQELKKQNIALSILGI